MNIYKLLKVPAKTSDGLSIYNFSQIPQDGYIKIANLFFKSDKQALKRAAKLVACPDGAMVEIEEMTLDPRKL